MEDTIIARLKALQSCKSSSVNQFASEIGCEQSTISNQLNEKRSLSLKTIIAVLSAYTDVSPDWLLLGLGDMLRQTGTTYNFTQNKVGGHGAIGIDNTVTISEDTSKLMEQLKAKEDTILKLRDEIEKLRERNDKLVDKLINL